MRSIPRIVVVDAMGEIARIVRGALALLNRQSVLIEVPTSVEALAEVENSTIDLVVTAYQIHGPMHGIELADHIAHESLGTPVIVLAEEHDPQPDAQTLANAPFQYFVRPVAEPFLRGLRVALDGEAAVAAEEHHAAPSIDYGPLPPLETEKVRELVINLIRDVGAMGIIVADRTGRVWVDEGATGYIDRETLAAILGPMFARVVEISPLVGGHAGALHYYSGERLDVYGLGLGYHYLMFLIFEGETRRAMASVMLYGRQAVNQLIEMLGEDAYRLQRAEEAAAPEAPAKARRAPAPRVEAAAPPPPEKVKAAQKAPVAEPVSDLDVEALFAQSIDEGLADSLFNPEELSNLAEAIQGDDDTHVGYDEAIDMGILDE